MSNTGSVSSISSLSSGSTGVCSDKSSGLQWSHVGSQLEGELSVRVLSLTVDENKSSAEDSFSSEPDSGYNKGALKFLDLVEATLARQTKLSVNTFS